MNDDLKLDVMKLRAQMLTNFARYAAKVLTPKSGLNSMMLCCSQYFADEAGDAVHDSVFASKALVPVVRAPAKLDYQQRWKTLQWDDNEGAVFAFAAMCSEEGAQPYSDDEDAEYFEGGSSESPLALAQRVDGRLRLSWLGFPHRAWLDLRGGLADRDEFSDGVQAEYVEEPVPTPLEGDESKLLAQVRAAPENLEARAVLCDMWSQRGDPRGEFGALCFSAKRTSAALEKVADLVLKHGRGWLGPLAEVVPYSGALFGEGPFAEKLIVHFPDAKTFKRLGSDPHWSTVKRLTLVGEHGGVTPAMRNLREVGPLSAAQLAPLHKGAWKVEALDVIGSKAALGALETLSLPLTRLAVRAPATLKLAPLKKASYFMQLRELEVWLPSATDNVAARLAETMTALEALGSNARLRVGVESPAGRTGWVLQREAKGPRTLVLAQPDERIETGTALAKQLGVKLDPSWQSVDDWLHFGLGVHVDAK